MKKIRAENHAVDQFVFGFIYFAEIQVRHIAAANRSMRLSDFCSNGQDTPTIASEMLIKLEHGFVFRGLRVVLHR